MGEFDRADILDKTSYQFNLGGSSSSSSSGNTTTAKAGTNKKSGTANGRGT